MKSKSLAAVFNTLLSFSCLAGLIVLAPGLATANQRTTKPLPEMLFAALPDGEGEVYFSQPTTRYAHGILGDNIEAGALSVSTDQVRSFVLPRERVFEDLLPRLQDATGDGRPELIVVESHQDHGAAVSVYSIVNGAPMPLARSPWIGTSNRWLNPVGVADFNNDGKLEIAIVQTPHIGGILILYQLQGRELKEVARTSGYSNHEIGSRNLGLSYVVDWNCDGTTDIVLPDQNRRGVSAISFADNAPSILDHLIVTSAIDGNFSFAVQSEENLPVLSIPLKGGTIAQWTRNCSDEDG